MLQKDICVQPVSKPFLAFHAGAQSVSAAQRKAERLSQAQSVPSSGMAEWKEGQLFPEGWEDMNAFKKARKLLQSYTFVIQPV